MAASLRTRSFREAEHLAALLDVEFGSAFAGAEQTVTTIGDNGATPPDLNTALRGHLNAVLDADKAIRVERPTAPQGEAAPSRMAELLARLTAGQTAAEIAAEVQAVEAVLEARARWDGPGTQAAVRRAAALERAFRGDGEPWPGLLADATPERVAAADRAMKFLGEEASKAAPVSPPPTGEAAAAERAATPTGETAAGAAPATTAPAAPPTTEAVVAVSPPTKTVAETDRTPAKPLASSVVGPYFVRRKTVDGQTHQVMAQDGGTVRRFFEVAGDKPFDEYVRGDVLLYADTIRRAPRGYGKSPKDKDRPLAEIIAEADRREAETKRPVRRLSEKTVKRHISALAQFFLFAVNHMPPLLTASAHADLFAKHRFRSTKGARHQRDPWSIEDLIRLLASPVWRGCQLVHRSRPGPHIIRDWRFWIPLLALFHGARLEEFADLYRRDVGCDGGVWFLDVRESDRGDGHRRRLKTSNATRRIPLHAELIRMGFLDYVRRMAPNPDDPLFPDLLPQGPDSKRGPRFIRWFAEYRKAIGLYREGVAMQSFRHAANTRLRDAMLNEQQKRHIRYMLGHAQGGGEGEERYDKGPRLKAAAEPLALLRYPELDCTPRSASPWPPPVHDRSVVYGQ